MNGTYGYLGPICLQYCCQCIMMINWLLTFLENGQAPRPYWPPRKSEAPFVEAAADFVRRLQADVACAKKHLEEAQIETC